MSHASFLISVPNCIRHFFYSNQTILKIRIKRFLCQSPLPWGQETLEIVSEMLATILISFFLFHTSNIPWDNFNSMTKQDLCPSEEWPMHSTAGWKEISRRKLCLWQNILSEKSDIQIIILRLCIKFDQTSVTLSFGNCPSWSNSPGAVLSPASFASHTGWSKNPTSLNTH